MYFRLKEEATQQLYIAAPKLTYGDVEDTEGEDIPVYEVSSFSDKEVKLVLPWLPSALRVSVDYNKQIFTLPKGTQYVVKIQVGYLRKIQLFII